MPTPTRVIGLMPAAGQATRLGPLPMSKELFPIGFQPSGAGLRVVCHALLEKMRLAGITEAMIILRPGKWDIPAFLGDGAALDMRLAYLTVHVPFGVPFSLNQAYPFVRDSIVALGFPDILFQPDNAYQTLLTHLEQSAADVVLGLFPTDQPEKVGVVDFDASGQVHAILEKSQRTDLPYMWALAVWRPSFTEFLHQFITAQQTQLIGSTIPQTLKQLPAYREIPIGDVIQAAIQAGLRVNAEVFEKGHYLDIGTPSNLAQIMTQTSAPSTEIFTA